MDHLSSFLVEPGKQGELEQKPLPTLAAAQTQLIWKVTKKMTTIFPFLFLTRDVITVALTTSL